MSTIAAIATPPGHGGIGIVRVSGPDALRLLGKVFLPAAKGFKNFLPWHLHRGMVVDRASLPLDDALAVYMPAPRTFTGEDVAEIHCHGSPLILETLLARLFELGATPAAKGEFTRRAFMNGRMDLSQAEAVAELISAPSLEAVRYSINRLDGIFGAKIRELGEKLDDLRSLAFIGVDFPDDEVPALAEGEFASKATALAQDIRDLLAGAERARNMQQGADVVLAGAVNAGKSSLFNAIAGRERALVADMPGTTRDYLEEYLNLAGLPVRMLDTAGLRPDCEAGREDPVESRGMEKSLELLQNADLVLLVFDGANLAARGGLGAEDDILYRRIADMARGHVLPVWNKCDVARPKAFPPPWAGNGRGCIVSASTGENIGELCEIAKSMILGDDGLSNDNGIAPNVRQAEALRAAGRELEELLAEKHADCDLILTRLDTVAAALEDVLGLTAHDQLLDRIFSNFCIGK